MAVFLSSVPVCAGWLASGCGPSAAKCVDEAATPRNLTPNPGFECGGAAPSEWMAVYGTLEFTAENPHGGARAAKLTATAAGARFASRVDLISGAGVTTSCVSAWAKGSAPFLKLSVVRDEGGGSFKGYEFSSPVPSGWERVPPRTFLKVPHENSLGLQLVFELQTNRDDGMNARAGDVLFIDDVDVWESATGQCSERAPAP